MPAETEDLLSFMKSNLEKSEAGGVTRVAVQMPTVTNEQGEQVLLNTGHPNTRAEPDDFLYQSLPVDVSSPSHQHLQDH